ncbi:hypothetical protein MPER_00276, partial [Moniliophthora perniciosa FA553]
MPQVLPLVESWQKHRKLDEEVEDEKLFLPSDIPAATCVKLNLTSLTTHEASLREAQLNELIGKVKTVASSVGTMLDFRYKNVKNQDAKTRSEKEVANAFHRRDRLIIRYNHARESLIKLGVINGNDKDGTYPHMKPVDTHRLPVNLKRKI